MNQLTQLHITNGAGNEASQKDVVGRTGPLLALSVPGTFGCESSASEITTISSNNTNHALMIAYRRLYAPRAYPHHSFDPR